MGMAATQARYLSLTARQNNLEYQGQQINQERSILSQQTAELYNSLIDMKVPVPPSTSDYTKVVYTGVSGTNTFTIGNVIPENGTYIVDLEYQKIGNYISEAYTVACQDIPPYISLKDVTTSLPAQSYNPKYQDLSAYTSTDPINSGDILAFELNASTKSLVINGSWPNLNAGYSVYQKDTMGNYREVTNLSSLSETDVTAANGYYIAYKVPIPVPSPVKWGTSGFKLDSYSGSPTLDGLSESQILNGDYYIIAGNDALYITADVLSDTSKFDKVKNDDGQVIYIPKSGTNIGMKSTDAGASQYTNPDSTNPHYRYYIAGEPCMSMEYANSMHMLGSDDTFNSYIDAIKNTFSSEYGNLTGQDLISRVSNDFDVYFTQGSSGQLVPHFVRANDLLTGADVNGTKYVPSYDYTPNGTYTSSERTKDCMLTFDLNGRISEIKIPTKWDAGGNPVEYSTVKLNAATETDEKAYQDAYNEYVYKQAKYDKQQQEINAKTKVIQEEDRTLELRLRRLDTERQQITTEMDALEKVIKDNIDKSYKTFSG